MRLSTISALLATILCAHLFGVHAVPGDVVASSTVFSGTLHTLHYVSESTVYVLTSEHLYRSTDEGRHWYTENSRLPQCNAISCVKKLTFGKADKLLTILQGTGTRHWIAEEKERKVGNGDTSVAFSTFTIDEPVYKFIPHPTIRSRIAVITKSAKSHNVYYTENLGINWRLLISDIDDASWLTNTTAGFDTDVMVFTRTTSSKLPIGSSTATHSIVSSYNIKSDDTKSLIVGGQEFFYVSKYLFVATRDPSSSVVSLFVSSDNGRIFRKAKLPLELAEGSYTVLDTSEDTVFLNVFHNQNDGEPWGNVYLSDYSGSRYSVSLYNNRRIDSYCDFHKIESLEGVYVANQVANIFDDDCLNCKGFLECKQKCKFVSKISFDKGGMWRYIAAPKTDATGKPYTCSPDNDCGLHLHGLATGQSVSPVFSTSTAIGLIMATGNVGTHLQPIETGDVNTYFSRDGGLNWEEIARGSHVFKFADHGGLMLKAVNSKETDVIQYSWNEGLTWTDFNISTPIGDSMFIQKIYTNGNPLSRSFMLYGFRKNDVALKPIVVHLDLADLHTTECVLVSSPDDAKSDYETFKPASYSNGCLLGREVEYTRRKREAKCFNPIAEERPLKIKNCACFIDDYECDLGYERKYNGKGLEEHCLPISSDAVLQSKLPPSPCAGFFNESRGYIKEAGNTCEGGLDLNPIPRACPDSRASVMGALLVGVFLLLILGFLGYYGYHRSDRLKRFFNNRLPEFASHISYQSLIPTFGFLSSFGGGSAGAAGRVTVHGNETTHEFGLDDEDEEEDADAEIDEDEEDVNAPAVKSSAVTAELRGNHSKAKSDHHHSHKKAATATAATTTTTAAAARGRSIEFDDAEDV